MNTMRTPREVEAVGEGKETDDESMEIENMELKRESNEVKSMDQTKSRKFQVG